VTCRLPKEQLSLQFVTCGLSRRTAVLAVSDMWVIQKNLCPCS